MKFGTMKMTPEFMADMYEIDPERGKVLQMSVTTDGTDVSREEVESYVRKWVQARINSKREVMKSFPEEGQPRITADELIAGLTKL